MPEALKFLNRLQSLLFLRLSKNIYMFFLSLNMLTVCVRNDLGMEFAKSDSLLTHTFSTMVSYSDVMLICDFDFIFRSIF